MVTDDDGDDQNMFDNRQFENDISPNYKPDNLSFSFFHFSPATFFDQDDAFFHYHQLLQSAATVVSPADSITTTTMAADESTQTHPAVTSSSTKLMDAAAAAASSSADNNIINDPSKILNFIPMNNKMMMMKTNNKIKKIPKRRLAGKKDRHSKIVTAQGPRDRRMRLSLPIAREFFSLQDMLGVDKPSKTVQWLLTMSKSAIEELTITTTTTNLSQQQRMSSRNKYRNGTSTTTDHGSGSKSTTGSRSSISECEEEEEEADHRRSAADFSKRKSLEISSSTTTPSDHPNNNKAGKKMRPSSSSSRKSTTYHHPLARESRAKARARARERTIEKMQSQRLFIDHNNNKSKQCLEENYQLQLNDPKKVRSNLLITSTTAGSGTYDLKSSLQMVSSTSTDEVIMKHSSPPSTEDDHDGLVKNTATINHVDLDQESNFMMITRKAPSSSSSIFSYPDDIGLIDDGSNSSSNNSTSSVLNFSEIWDFTANNASSGQTNSSSYCAINDMIMNQLAAGR